MPGGPTDHHHLDVESSIALEQIELQRRGIEDAPALFAQHYRCDYPRCASVSLFPDRLRVAPAVRAGRPVCPLCGNPVVAVGARQRSVEVKVMQGDREAARLAIESGEVMTLGRRGGDGAVAVDDLVDPALAGRISRLHLALTFTDENRLLAMELGSKNGSWLQRGGDGSLGAPQRIRPRQWVEVGEADCVVLPGQMWLVRSQRRYPMADRRRLPDPDTTVGEVTRPAEPGGQRGR